MINHPTKSRFIFSEELLGKLTYTAYMIALKAGIKKPFLEVELELWNSLRKIMDESLSSIKEIKQTDHFVFKQPSRKYIHLVT